MTRTDIAKLVVAIALPQIAGGIGALFTTSAIPTWYATLAKPELSPPNFVFGPVWTTLFVFMGIAAFLVWKKGIHTRGVRIALVLFLFQLVLNTLWSIIFFGLKSPFGALIEIAVLWLAIVATMIAFGRISRTAFWLMVPYILWVSFASYLTYAIWTLNA